MLLKMSREVMHLDKMKMMKKLMKKDQQKEEEEGDEEQKEIRRASGWGNQGVQ